MTVRKHTYDVAAHLLYGDHCASPMSDDVIATCICNLYIAVMQIDNVCVSGM